MKYEEQKKPKKNNKTENVHGKFVTKTNQMSTRAGKHIFSCKNTNFVHFFSKHNDRENVKRTQFFLPKVSEISSHKISYTAHNLAK